MQSIVLRYLHLFCVAVMFEVNCDQFQPSDHRNSMMLYRSTGCAANCMQNNTFKTLRECYAECESQQNQTFNMPTLQNTTDVNIIFVCRTNSTLVVRVDFEASISRGTNWLYVVKAQETKNVLSDTLLQITDSPLVKFEGLEAKTTYKISATVVSASMQFVPAKKNSIIRTLPPHYMPAMVQNVFHGFFEADDTSNSTLLLPVSWLPDTDRVCSYEYIIVMERAEHVELNIDAINTVEIYDPAELYSTVLKSLAFGAVYAIGFRSKHYEKESELFWIKVKVPTCLEFYSYNLNICAPHTPQNISIIGSLLSPNVFNLTISWNTPPLNPDSYLLEIKDKINIYTFNITGDKTTLELDRIELRWPVTVTMKAFSVGGVSQTMDAHGVNIFNQDNLVISSVLQNDTILKYSLAIGALFIVMIILIFIASNMLIKYLAAKRLRRRERHQYFKGLEKIDPGDPETSIGDFQEHILARLSAFQKDVDATSHSHELEVDKMAIEFLKVIGQGAFGLVRKAILQPSNRTVAVKTLRDSPTVEDMQAFYHEIEVMKSVPKHPNIVGIIGHYTRNVREMMLVTEYCDRGNLLIFLQNIYLQLSRQSHTNNKSGTVEYKCICTPAYARKSPSSIININNESMNKNMINTVFNRLYDESVVTSTSDTDAVIDANTNDITRCNGSCKCDIEIAPLSRLITIKDCSCVVRSKNDERSSTVIDGCLDANKNNNNEKCLMKNGSTTVENRSYFDEPICWPKTNLETIIDCMDSAKPDLIKTTTTAMANDDNGDHMMITSNDLLLFALQIANGMAFLSLNKVVHRDLAARNVLVCSNKTVKISDFGLSRDVYEDNVYNKTGGGKLPIKWMAIESLLRRTYTCQSDVWSFGILLYEIVTLGSSPYPYIQKNEDLLKYLQSNNRMNQPSTCSNELFDLMKSCWEYEPLDRPTFSTLHKTLEMFQQTEYNGTSNHIKIGDNLSKINVILSPPKSASNSYLQPI